jgi:hypothetical protein
LVAVALFSGLVLPGVVRATPAVAQVAGSVLLAAGDVGNCSNTVGATATAHLIGGNAGTEVRPLWQDLHNAGAEIVLDGHNHQYERFAPQTPTGAADPAKGIREFVVGTGGTSHYPFGTVQPNSQVRNNTTYGVLKLALDPGSYSWKFLPVAGQSFTDSGTGTCH